ncbi:poly(R)-hydroxyalkanoic acid synthase subunit PhaE [Arhodomonas sp. AD133]|uniref:poly(R)-hydroxyalkanoic acid synthase subunit PhaE n=1 Tax=Arhodomonas sp. AD133 TaxID=3415009 RepID=UPI003EC09C1E
MQAGADQWQTEIERWLDTLSRLWGLGDADGTSPLATLRDYLQHPVAESPAAARESAAAVRRWREQLPETLPDPGAWRQVLSQLAPLGALLGDGSEGGIGPAGDWQARGAALETALHHWQQAGLGLAAALADVLADGLEDLADKLTHQDEPADGKDWLPLWSACVEARYEAALTEGDLAEHLGGFLAGVAEVRTALTRMVDELAPALGLPSRAELSDAQDRLAAMERRQRALEARMATIPTGE